MGEVEEIVTSGRLCLHIGAVVPEAATPVHFASCPLNVRQNVEEEKVHPRPASCQS